MGDSKEYSFSLAGIGLGDFVKDIKTVKENVVKNMENLKFAMSLEIYIREFMKGQDAGLRKKFARDKNKKLILERFNIIFSALVSKSFPYKEDKGNKIIEGKSIGSGNSRASSDGCLRLDQQSNTVKDRGLNFLNFQIQINDLENEVAKNKYGGTSTIACVLVPLVDTGTYKVPIEMVYEAFFKSLESQCNYKIMPNE